MSPLVNRTNYLRNLSHEPMKKEEYIQLMWHWKTRDYVNASGMTADQFKSWEHLPILPIAATLILTLTVFLLLIFQRNPSLVAGIVAAGLGTIALYLFLSTLQENRVRYE